MKPNYKQGNIVNLMSSLLQGLGAHSRYPQLDRTLSKEIKKASNVVLVVIDGLGADSLRKLPQGSFLRKYYYRTLTTVFPSTTTAAITTFLTGVSPQEHGFVAWYMKLKEFGGEVVIILPYITKEGKPLSHSVSLKMPRSLFEQVPVPTYLILKRRYYESRYNHLLGGKAHFLGYRAAKLAEFAQATQKAILSPGRKYIYTYWSRFDDLSHWYGKESREARQHLWELDGALERLAGKLLGTNTLLLITADHGQISTTKEKTIILEQHPQFLNCLTASLCGEARAAMFYVHPEKRKQFEQYVQKKWGNYCQLSTSSELLQQGYFGLHQPHPSLKDRIGDYILIPQSNYIFKEHTISKKHPFLVGHHGGLSREEMEVPLVKVVLL